MELDITLEEPVIHLQEGSAVIEDTARPADEILAERAARENGPALFIP